MKERAEAAERSWRHLSDGTPCQTSGRTEFAEMAASSSLSELRLLSWLFFFSLSPPSLARGSLPVTELSFGRGMLLVSVSV